jgi:hypothetical protein
MLAGISNEQLSNSNATILGVAGEASVALIDKINAKAESSVNTPTKPLKSRRLTICMTNYGWGN